MPSRYDTYKDDWRYIEEIQDVTLIPVCQEGDGLDEGHPALEVKAHETNTNISSLSFDQYGTSEDRKEWLVFLDTTSGKEVEPTAVIDDGTNRWEIESVRRGVFGTRAHCLCKLVPAALET